MTERVAVVEKILGANDQLAEQNRARLDAEGVENVRRAPRTIVGGVRFWDGNFPPMGRSGRDAIRQDCRAR